ncbi:MAG TPA: polysaccharide biosynthesis/export family protein [Candidatus Krumholzibacterium sp.]|nr:polysaccharide biosynthesis/export family protein [Candidatus Krumholzibacterium sp.]
MRKNLTSDPEQNATQPSRGANDIPGNVSTSTHASGMDFASGPQYRLGPEDVLRISVWGNKDLTLDLVVRPDGKISVPLIQDIQAEGLTAAELADLIKQRLLGFIKEPHVTVVVLQVNSAKFYVVGEVKKPGTYFLRGYVSVLQALAMAQGFTEFASLRSIRIVRNNGGTQEVRVVSFYDIIDGGGEVNYLIRPGDTIVVP